jgi:hypothetical protein
LLSVIYKVIASEALAAAILFLGIAITPSAHAAEVSTADLEAVTRSLGFLESLPRDRSIDVGIVYAPNAGSGRTEAVQIAERFNALPGPNQRILHAVPVAVDNLAQIPEGIDVIYLMTGVSSESASIIDTARRRHLVTISNDPACLDQKCCVLMIHAGRGVEITIQTALADAVGARFSTVFSMMVKRK